MVDAWFILETGVTLILILIVMALLWAFFRHLRLRPSNDRSWVNDNERLTTAEFDDGKVTIRNVRDFEWRSNRDFDKRWVDMEINLDDVSKIWFVLEYFDPSRRQMAHTIMSFEMRDGTRIALSLIHI